MLYREAYRQAIYAAAACVGTLSPFHTKYRMSAYHHHGWQQELTRLRIEEGANSIGHHVADICRRLPRREMSGFMRMRRPLRTGKAVAPNADYAI